MALPFIPCLKAGVFWHGRINILIVNIHVGKQEISVLLNGDIQREKFTNPNDAVRFVQGVNP
jgi:hypothetical protein